MAKELYIGIMTGTSLDGADYSLIEIDSQTQAIRHLQSHGQLLPNELKQKLELVSSASIHELKSLWQLDVEVSEYFANGVIKLLSDASVPAERVRAIGCHGVTVGHYPELKFTKQLVCGSTLAHLTGIDSVVDFRMADVAAGGQGAPLVPMFHRLLFQQRNGSALLNLGGIANLTVLPSENNELLGFDTGPANTLINLWCQRHTGESYDRDGEWGVKGQLNQKLLDVLMQEAYFDLAYPKSTGKELFNLAWLDSKLAPFASMEPIDVQHTLYHLTAFSVAKHVARFPELKYLFVCGGGVHNDLLMTLLSDYCQGCDVQSVAEMGSDPDYLEAMAFAWLAFCRIHGVVANDKSVTGACQQKVLGAWYQK